MQTLLNSWMVSTVVSLASTVTASLIITIPVTATPSRLVIPPVTSASVPVEVSPPALSMVPVMLSTLPASPPDPTPTLPQPSSQTEPSLLDPDLGELRLRPLSIPTPPASSPAPVLYLIGDTGYFRSSNLFAGIDPITDGLVAANVSLFAIPALGPETTLIASASAGLVRYSTRPLADYNQLQTYVGLSQKLFDNTYGEIGWRNQHLFDRSTGNRFLNNHMLLLSLTRQDALTPDLSLNTAYQFRQIFSDPIDRSQRIHTLRADLDYQIQPNLTLNIGYQLALSQFTQRSRHDTFHQVTAGLSYGNITSGRITLFSGYSFGLSSDAFVDFNGLVLGIGFNWALPF